MKMLQTLFCNNPLAIWLGNLKSMIQKIILRFLFKLQNAANYVSNEK